MESDILRIGRKIRDRREDMDIKQIDIANQIPMSQSSYSKIERDEQEPNLEQLRRICQILRLNPSYLLSLDTYPEVKEKDQQFAEEIKNLYLKYYEKRN